MKRSEAPVAIITGGTRGIGLGIAKALAREGYALCLNGLRDAARVEAVLKEVGNEERVRYVQGDIGTAEGRAAILEFCRAAFARLDLMVNNAGIAPASRVDLLDGTEFRSRNGGESERGLLPEPGSGQVADRGKEERSGTCSCDRQYIFDFRLRSFHEPGGILRSQGRFEYDDQTFRRLFGPVRDKCI